MFKIADASEEVKQFRVSKDAQIAVVVMGNDDVHVYRLFDQKTGEFLGDKKTLAPVNKFKIRDPEYSKVIDLHIHKKPLADPNQASAPSDYSLYLVSPSGVLLYTSIEKREESKLLHDEWPQLTLTPNCSDLNSQGLLIADAAQRLKEGEDASQ
jgi:hypothetical protein